MAEKIYLYDLETTDWDQFLLGAAASVDGSWSDVFGDLNDMIAEIRIRGGTWIAHNGGLFDTLLLMNVLPTADEVVLSGSRVLKATWKRTADYPALRLRDSYPWWFSSLATIGEAVGQPKFEELDVSHLESYDPSLVAAYCQQDVEVMMAAFRQCRAYMRTHNARPAYTAGGSAVNLFRALEGANYQILKLHRWKVDDHMKVLGYHTVRGGRTEVGYYGEKTEVHCYDVHSSYPARYFEGPLPIGFSRMVADPGPSIRFGHKAFDDGAALLRAFWNRSENTFPAPVLGEGNRGYGECQTWVTRDEWTWLESLQPDLTCAGAIYPERWQSFGAAFTSELYAQKREGIPWAKIFINSLHGKLCEHSVRLVERKADATHPWARSYDGEIYLDDPFDDDRSILLQDAPEYWPDVTLPSDGLCCPLQQPLAGAYILARARTALTRAMLAVKNFGGEVYYCDTDSIHTNLTPAKFGRAIANVNQRLGDGMGEWGHEGCSSRALWVAPKVYCLDDKKKAKGVAAHRLSYDDYRRALTTGVEVSDRGIDTFASSLKQGVPSTSKKASRTIRATYNGKQKVVNGFARYS